MVNIGDVAVYTPRKGGALRSWSTRSRNAECES